MAGVVQIVSGLFDGQIYGFIDLSDIIYIPDDNVKPVVMLTGFLFKLNPFCLSCVSDSNFNPINFSECDLYLERVQFKIKHPEVPE